MKYLYNGRTEYTLAELLSQVRAHVRAEDPETFCKVFCQADRRYKERGAGSLCGGDEHPCFYCEVF